MVCVCACVNFKDSQELIIKSIVRVKSGESSPPVTTLWSRYAERTMQATMFVRDTRKKAHSHGPSPVRRFLYNKPVIAIIIVIIINCYYRH